MMYEYMAYMIVAYIASVFGNLLTEYHIGNLEITLINFCWGNEIKLIRATNMNLKTWLSAI